MNRSVAPAPGSFVDLTYDLQNMHDYRQLSLPCLSTNKLFIDQ